MGETTDFAPLRSPSPRWNFGVLSSFQEKKAATRLEAPRWISHNGKIAVEARRPVSSDLNSQSQAAAASYQAGKVAFERGQYREAVEELTKASAQAVPTSQLAGEIQLWLVTAYEAVGQRSEAISLCRQLHSHPDWETRKQSRRLLYILEAPQLSLRPEWLTQIPDLEQVGDSSPKDRKGSTLVTPSRPSHPKPQPAPVDLSQVETQDNRFIWIALLGTVLLLGGLIWFS